MRIALVQPVVELGKSIRVEKAPTGIQCLAGYLREHGHQVRMCHRVADDELLDELAQFDPDAVGISAATVAFPAARDLAGRIKTRFQRPAAKQVPRVVLGGWHATGCVVSYLKGHEPWSLGEILSRDSPLDYVVAGEGEKCLFELLQLLERRSGAPADEELAALPGVGFVRRDGAIAASPPQRLTDIDALPDPVWDDLDIDLYRDLRDPGILDLSVHAQRGCRYQCTFCATPVAYPGCLVTRRPVERVTAYVGRLIEQFAPRVITFTDEDFMSSPEWLGALCDQFIERGFAGKVQFDSFAGIRDLSRLEAVGVLPKMKAAGFFSFFAGIESFNPATLDLYKRPRLSPREKSEENVYAARVQRAVQTAARNGLVFMGDYMVGFFLESEAEVREGFRRLQNIEGIHYVYFPILTPFPGTELWRLAVERDLLLREHGRVPWEKFDCSHQVTQVAYDLAALREEFEQEFYTGPIYQRTMVKAAVENPELRDCLHLPLFRKLAKDYPDNARIAQCLATLEALRTAYPAK